MSTEQRLSTARSVLTGTATILGAHVVSMVLTFLAQRLILSTITKDANGLLFAERRMVDLLLIIAVDLGLNIIAMRRAVQEPERIGTILSSTLALRLMLWIPASAAALIYGHVAGYSLVDVVLWCLYCLLASKATLARFLTEIPFRSRMRFGVPALSIIIDSALFIVLLYANASALTPTVVIICFVASALPGFVLMLILDRGRTFRVGLVDRTEVRRLFVEALPVMGMIALVALHDKVDAIMLAWWSPQSEVGVYGAAYVSLAPITTTLPAAITMAVTPVIARMAITDWEQTSQYAITVLRALAFTALLSSAVLTILAPEVILLVSKGKYAANVLHFTLFLWMPLPIFVMVFAQDAIVALGHSRQVTFIGAALAVSIIVGGAVLIPWADALGATVAKIVSVTAGAVTALVLLRAIFGNRLQVRFFMSVVVVLAIGVAGCLWYPTVMPRWYAAAANGATVFLASALAGLVHRSDFRLFMEILRSRRAATPA